MAAETTHDFAHLRHPESAVEFTEAVSSIDWSARGLTRVALEAAMIVAPSEAGVLSEAKARVAETVSDVSEEITVHYVKH